MLTDSHKSRPSIFHLLFFLHVPVFPFSSLPPYSGSSRVCGCPPRSWPACYASWLTMWYTPVISHAHPQTPSS